MGKNSGCENDGIKKRLFARRFVFFAAAPILFAGLAFLIYSNTFGTPFVFDDHLHIPDNRHIRLTELNFKDIIAAGVKSHAEHRPVANISFALNYYFHQYDVAGYHLTNIFIHILTAVFVWLLVKNTLLTPSLRSKYKHAGPIAFFAALLWLAHPLQTQSVTYIVQRMNSLAAMFYVLSLLLYIKGRLAGQDAKKTWPWYIGCVIAGLLALGSKQIAATLPLFIFLYEWFFFQDLSRNWLRRRLPYFMAIVFICVLVGLVYLGPNPFEKLTWSYAQRHFTMAERLLTQFRIVIFYVSLLFYPNPARLNLDHDFAISHSLIDPPTTLLCLALILALIALAVWSAKKERLLSFCILWFFGNLVIESSIIGLELVFEHRLYLPSVFVSLATVTLVWRYIKQAWARVTVVCIVLLLLCNWTYQRNSVYADAVTLWADCAAKSPAKPRPYSNLATALKDSGRPAEAVVYFNKSLELEPDSAEVHSNLGNALSKLGQTDEAIEHYKKALNLKPNFSDAHYNLALALARQGKTDEAIAEYRDALRFKPDDVDALSNLGFELAKQGNFDEAIKYYKKALGFEPKNVIAHGRLGLALAGVDKIDEALEQFRIVLEAHPDDVEMQCNVGILLERQGKITEAIKEYRQALQINPDYTNAQELLKAALSKQKNR